MTSAENLALAVRSKAPRARAVRQLKQWIGEGVLLHGQPLPTEQALAEQLQVSRGTLRTALDMLNQEGLISNQGRQRIVVAPPQDGNGVHPSPVWPNSSPARSPLANPGNMQQGVDGTPTVEQATRIGILGDWTGQSHEYIWNNIAMRAMEKISSEQGNITLCYFNRFSGAASKRKSLVEGIAELRKEGVERFAILFRTKPEDIEVLGTVIDFEQTPIVCIQDQGAELLPVCQISYDIEYSGYLAATHLLNRGWRSLVAFAPFDATWVSQRLRGIESAIRVQGLSPADVLTVWPGGEREPMCSVPSEVQDSFRRSGLKGGQQMLRNMIRPCGVIAPNDTTAYGILDAARQLGLAPGSDFGIVGFDDSTESRSYGLTSLRPPIEVMSQEAIRILLNKQFGKQSPLHLSFRSELVARTSTEFYTGSASNTQ